MDLKRIEKAAREQGWTIGRTSKGHMRFIPPDPNRKTCFFSGTPGDRRAVWILLTKLRREGFIWPWPPTKKERSKKEDEPKKEEPTKDRPEGSKSEETKEKK